MIMPTPLDPNTPEDQLVAYDANRKATWYRGTRILTPPDIRGEGPRGRGRAWRVNQEHLLANLDEDKRKACATVAMWLVWCPFAHPAWDHYFFGVVHLRPGEGLPPPKLEAPDATHEFTIVSLDPSSLLPDPTNLKKFNYLAPFDAAIQFKVADDAMAEKALEVMVTLCCDGEIGADRDHQGTWTAALWKTAHKLNKTTTVKH